MTDYTELTEELSAISDGVAYGITILANTSALLYDRLGDLNWCGFYLWKNGALLLGPFQGKLACTKIELGKGVCGTAAERGESLVVPNAHEFPGHIPCDGASNSELVVPLYVNGEFFGVLDLDSPVFSRFTEEDRTGLEACARELERILGALAE